MPSESLPVAPKKFTDLDLPELVHQGIRDAGFESLTPIQALTLPYSLAGKDVAGKAQTGTGKTAAFLIATFSRLLRQPRPEKFAKSAPRALILAPTRELVIQIERDAKLLGSHIGMKIHAVYGGVDYEKQRRELGDQVDILVGTPGRLIDYLKQNVYTLKGIEVLIIDEADRMFDMGFIQDLRFILRRLPPFDKRQSMLFSATLSHRIMELGYEHMNNPEPLEVAPDKMTADRVRQLLFHVGKNEKFSLLLGILKREGGSKILIFTNTKRVAAVLEERLTRNGYSAGALTGDIQQRQRLKILKMFSGGELNIVIATDVASRGLHIEGVSHVINYDLPQDAEDYVHRIGRTARAGAEGDAISLACEEYVTNLEAIEEYINHKIPVEWPEDSMFLKEVPRPRQPAQPHPPKQGHQPFGKPFHSSPGGKPGQFRRKPPRSSPK